MALSDEYKQEIRELSEEEKQEIRELLQEEDQQKQESVVSSTQNFENWLSINAPKILKKLKQIGELILEALLAELVHQFFGFS